jgi:hypothetical protein
MSNAPDDKSTDQELEKPTKAPSPAAREQHFKNAARSKSRNTFPPAKVSNP